MPKGYVVAHAEVTNPEKWAEYVAKSKIALDKFGGKPIVRGGRCEIAEGMGRPRNVILEFASYEEARGFAHLLAMLAVEAVPAIATIARPIRSRGGKVYVDWGQNGHGRTIVAPLAVRPLPGAPVSCPLRWEEVTARLDPRRFTLRTVRARLEAQGDPLAPVLGAGIDLAAALERLESGR